MKPIPVVSKLVAGAALASCLLPLGAFAQKPGAPAKAPAPPADPNSPERFFKVQEWSFNVSSYTLGGHDFWEGEGLTLHDTGYIKNLSRADGPLVWEALPDPKAAQIPPEVLAQLERLKKMGMKVPDLGNLPKIPLLGFWSGPGSAFANVNEHDQIDSTHDGKQEYTHSSGSGSSPCVMSLGINADKGTFYFQVAAGDGKMDASQRRRISVNCKLFDVTKVQVDLDGKRMEEHKPTGIYLQAKDQPLPKSGLDLSGTLKTENKSNHSVTITTWRLAPKGQFPSVYLENADPGFVPELDATTDVNVRWTSGNPTKMEFRLQDVSSEPGTCLNSADRNNDPDVAFAPGQGGLTVTGNLATAEGPVKTVRLVTKDYGAYTKLKARGLFEGKWIEAESILNGGQFCTVPLDADGNHIADAWEAANGFPGKPADADDDAEPAGQANVGDGLTYYEEYRGLETEDGKHIRTNPKAKEICVVDPQHLLDKASFQAATGVVPLFLKAEQVQMGRVDFNAGFADGPKKFCVTLSKVETLVDPENTLPTLGGWGQNGGSVADEPARTRVFTHRIEQAINQALLTLLRDAKANPGGKSAMLFAKNGVDARLIDSALLAYQNSDNTARLIAQLKTWVAVHEVGHACDIDHHMPEQDGGNETCPMRVVSTTEKIYGIPRLLTIAHSGKMPFGISRFCRNGDNCWKHLRLAPK